MNTVSEMFNKAFDKINARIAFSTEWKNGTGYLDGLVNANVGLRPGECATTVDDKKRRVLVIGSPVGNIVLFERYSPTEEARSSIVVGNYPSEITNVFGGMGGIGSALTVEGFERLFHSPTWNIGLDLDTLTRQFARAAQPKVKLQQVEVETMLQPDDVTMGNIHDIIKFTNPSIAAIADQHPVLKGVLYFHAGLGQYAKSIEEQARSIEARFGEEFKVLLETKDYPSVASRMIEITCDDLTNTLEYATAFKGIVSPMSKATCQVVLRGIRRNAGRIGGLVGTCVKFGMEVSAEVAAVKQEIVLLKEGFMASDAEGAVKH